MGSFNFLKKERVERLYDSSAVVIITVLIMMMRMVLMAVVMFKC